METSTIREAVAVFDDPQKLERAMSELQSNGIDRANLSLLAHTSLAKHLPPDTHSLADDPDTPREAAVSDTDLRQERVLGTSLVATIAALAAAGFTVATGGVAAAVIAAAVAAGGAGAVGALVGRRLGEDEEAFLETQLAHGGVLLWVRTPDADTERRAIDVLRGHSSYVRLHDLPAAPMPLSAQDHPG
ncbi:MAG: hypothetical protein JO081_17370 [Alphaproteobacteria bacterium]|nr:hypothetical protein [Alphaproteobacteria bacterium]